MLSGLHSCASMQIMQQFIPFFLQNGKHCIFKSKVGKILDLIVMGKKYYDWKLLTTLSDMV